MRRLTQSHISAIRAMKCSCLFLLRFRLIISHTHVEKVGEDGAIIITHIYNYTVFWVFVNQRCYNICVSPARCRENKYARTAGAVRACSMTIAVISPPRRVLDLGSHLRVVVGGAVWKRVAPIKRQPVPPSAGGAFSFCFSWRTKFSRVRYDKRMKNSLMHRWWYLRERKQRKPMGTESWRERRNRCSMRWA